MAYDPAYYQANKEKYKQANERHRKNKEYHKKRVAWHLEKLYESINESKEKDTTAKGYDAAVRKSDYKAPEGYVEVKWYPGITLEQITIEYYRITPA